MKKNLAKLGMELDSLSWYWGGLMTASVVVCLTHGVSLASLFGSLSGFTIAVLLLLAWRVWSVRYLRKLAI